MTTKVTKPKYTKHAVYFHHVLTPKATYSKQNQVGIANQEVQLPVPVLLLAV